MATASKKVTAKKTGSKATAKKVTYTPDNGKQKAAFKIPAAPVKKAKAKHFIPAALRPHIATIGKDLSAYVMLVTDMVSDSLMYGKACGLIGGGKSFTDEDRKDISTTSYYLHQIFIVLAKYDFSGPFPLISKEDSIDIIEHLEECFNAGWGYTHKEYSHIADLIEDMSANACILSSVANDQGVDLQCATNRLTKAVNIIKLSYAVFSQNAAKRLEHEEKLKVHVDLAPLLDIMPVEVAVAFLHKVAKKWAKPGYTLRKANDNTVCFFTCSSIHEADSLSQKTAFFTPLFCKALHHIAAEGEMYQILEAFAIANGLQPNT